MARGYLGIGTQDIDSGLAKGFGVPNARMALVTDVTAKLTVPNRTGQSGDVIVVVNGKAISSADSLSVRILATGARSARPGEYLPQRRLQKPLPVTLAEQPAEMERDLARPDSPARHQ